MTSEEFSVARWPTPEAQHRKAPSEQTTTRSMLRMNPIKLLLKWLTDCLSSSLFQNGENCEGQLDSVSFVLEKVRETPSILAH